MLKTAADGTFRTTWIRLKDGGFRGHSGHYQRGSKPAAVDPTRTLVGTPATVLRRGLLVSISSLQHGQVTFLTGNSTALGPASGNRLASAERDQQKVMVAELRKRLDRAGIPHRANDSHIVPVMVGDATKCKWISDWLPDKAGIYVQPINYPPVPPQLLRAWLPSRADRFLKVDLAENLSQSLPSDF